MKLFSVYMLQILTVSVSSQLIPLLPVFSAPDTVQAPVIMDPSKQAPLSQKGVLISDVMGRDRSVNVFAGFARDVALVSERLDSSAANSTVLAPLNSAFDKLPGKPWENSREYSTFGASAYEGDEGRDRARRNLQRLVEAHIVPVSPWPEKQKARSLLDGDREIWWESNDGVTTIQPDGIEIQRVASKVGNGEVWIIKAVREYA
ncbi:FAS1 domain-containing protein [Xylaria nigripes]|nr:FAS1 domain-containing protein [Xylaria nigripes]